MWTKKYLVSVLLVTLATLVVGFALWTSEKKQILDPFESWSRGPEVASVTLHAFVDFT
ncbi:MAG: hypothetical protein HOC20_00730 [Chloroflexi bacterium]|jgi:hypothetical protein|nr:hypothetical protein [Chloroflexota bacterium]